MKQNILIIGGVMILLLVSLTYLYPKLTQPPKPTEFGDVVITAEHTGCFGPCPIYKLTIYGDGRVMYEGQEHVNVAGKQTSQIPKDKVKELVNEFYRINFFSLKDNTYTDEGCFLDAGSVITSITIAGKTKRINDYHGCPAPKELRELEAKIDELVNSKQWVEKQ